MRVFSACAALALLCGCAGGGGPAPNAAVPSQAGTQMRTARFDLFDSARGRLIPVVAYDRPAGGPPRRLAIINHGYGGRNTDYSFVARTLVAHGYYVASLQHELPGDGPMPTTGEIYPARLPFWRRGAENIAFALRALHRREPSLDTGHPLLMGHSNGGDMVMLFAREHPEDVDKVISFDSRRFPFPRSARPAILSLRSADQLADLGVLPSAEEQARYGMTVIRLPGTIHNDMLDGATDAQKAEMNLWITRFLEAP
ncbi:serine aminopeptidase domain-containing protein [Longimicrobium terrae]|uniref:Dienelactone hydrolase n=1 Tax=Longimicrobium terrae TaxID=1639882 RepID=A0A841GY59_9BACT|nr:alpha/beta hydrolase [Longimicrobium terrae]MBB4636286.1 dienelactone hydrolase [Longimicrobium terrae]MBB6070682.1 dienelactone hydrolase [Longimicrobium terrae]NNC29664.1 alpha/beta hydrolase [Longimicrobium terrae]